MRKQSRIQLFVIIGIWIVSIGFYIYWFWWEHSHSLSTDSNRWGAFGDFVGGILNPLIALYAAYWLVKSIQLQQLEISAAMSGFEEARQEQKEQREILKISTESNVMISEIEVLNSMLSSCYATRSYYLQQIREHRIHNLPARPTHLLNLEGQREKTDDAMELLRADMLYLSERREKILRVLYATVSLSRSNFETRD